MGRCYTFNLKREGALVVKATGVTSGLILTLNAQPEEYCGDSSKARAGFRIQIHRAGEVPQPYKYGQDISPGFYHNFAIRRKKVAFVCLYVCMYAWLDFRKGYRQL